jgi:hypothetical protein
VSKDLVRAGYDAAKQRIMVETRRIGCIAGSWRQKVPQPGGQSEWLA